MRKAFLAPWHPEVETIRRWFLAKAQVKTGAAIHAAHDVINHHHTRVTTTAENLPEFLRISHGEASKALNALLAREGYDPPREVFDDRQTHTLRLLDAAAQASHHVYEHLNTVAAGLVSRPEHMPGLRLSHERWRSGVIMVPRPSVYVDPGTNPAELPLVLTPDPDLYWVFDGDLDAIVHHLTRLCDHGRRQLREARRGRPVLGAKGVRRIHPWSEPRTSRERGGQRIPSFKVGARDITGRLLSAHAAAEVTRFRREHREVRLARCDGEAAVYPFGTFAARVYQGAPVAPEPHPDAVLVKPGRTLEEVQAELAERRARHAGDPEAQRAERREIFEEVKAAWADEAASIVELDDLDMSRSSTTSPPTDAGTQEGTSERGAGRGG